MCIEESLLAVDSGDARDLGQAVADARRFRAQIFVRQQEVELDFALYLFLVVAVAADHLPHLARYAQALHGFELGVAAECGARLGEQFFSAGFLVAACGSARRCQQSECKGQDNCNANAHHSGSS